MCIEPFAVSEAVNQYTQVVDAVIATMNTVRKLEWGGGPTDQHGTTFSLVTHGVVSITGAQLADDSCA